MYRDLQDTRPHSGALGCKMICEMAVMIGNVLMEGTRGQGYWVVGHVNVEITENDGRS